MVLIYDVNMQIVLTQSRINAKSNTKTPCSHEVLRKLRRSTKWQKLIITIYLLTN